MTRRYADFRRRADAARGNRQSAEALRDTFGDSYWYYFTFTSGATK